MSAPIIKVTSLAADNTVFTHDVFDTGKTRISKLSFHPADRVPVLVQFCAGGKIPAFGYEEGKFGKNVTIHVDDPEELANLEKFQDTVCMNLIQNKDKFFNNASEQAVIENNAQFYGPPRSHDFGSWPATFKAYLKNDTVIVDTDGTRITDPTTLNRSVWVKAIVELSNIYAAGKKKSGVSKHWRYIQVKKKEPELELIPL